MSMLIQNSGGHLFNKLPRIDVPDLGFNCLTIYVVLILYIHGMVS